MCVCMCVVCFYAIILNYHLKHYFEVWTYFSALQCFKIFPTSFILPTLIIFSF